MFFALRAYVEGEHFIILKNLLDKWSCLTLVKVLDSQFELQICIFGAKIFLETSKMAKVDTQLGDI